MKVYSRQLIEELREQTNNLIIQAEGLKSLDDVILYTREHDKAWNILECLEHLNLYGDFYLEEIEQNILKSNHAPDKMFKSGMLGAYLTKSMLPKKKLNKMKTFRDKDTLHRELDRGVIERNIAQQYRLLDLLEKAEKVSLDKVKINISISKWIKLKLGDTFQFYINHMIRHFRQIDRIRKYQEVGNV